MNRTERRTAQYFYPIVVVWFAMFSVFLVVYWLTTQRGASWQDSGNFQIRIIRGEYFDRSLVLSHPTYIYLANLFVRLNLPFGPQEAMAARFSGLGMAIALANVASILTYVTKRIWIGVAIAMIVGVTHAVWWLSTIAEVYTWSVAFLTIELGILVVMLKNNNILGAGVMFLAFVSGVGFSIHNFALLPLPIYCIVAVFLIMKRKLSRFYLLGAILAYLLGASPYLFEIGKRIGESSDPLSVVKDALVGSYGGAVVNIGFRLPPVLNLGLDALSFMNILLPVAFFGILRSRHYLGRPLYYSLLAITLIETAFVLRYPVPDQFTFMLPSLVMLGIFAGIGLMAWSLEFSQQRTIIGVSVVVSIILPILVYTITPEIVNLTGWSPSRSRELPFRDEVRYWLVPWKHNEDSAELFSHSALEEAMPNGVIFADATAQFPLVLVRNRNARYADVRIPSRFSKDAIPEDARDLSAFCVAIGERPLYAVSPIPGYLDNSVLQITTSVKKGVLYELHLDPGVCSDSQVEP